MNIKEIEITFIILWIFMSMSSAYWIIRYGFKKKNQTGENDEKKALYNFAETVFYSQDVLFIYDDGNNFPSSVYNHRISVDVIKKRLDENEDFKVYVLFNHDEPLKVKEELASYGDRFICKIRDENDGVSAKRDEHYKIGDGGMRIYYTKHDPNQTKRPYWKATYYRAYKFFAWGKEFDWCRAAIKNSKALQEKYFPEANIKY